MRPRKYRGGIGGMPHPNGCDPCGAAHDYHQQCGVHTHPHSTRDPHHHLPPGSDCVPPTDWDDDYYPEEEIPPNGGGNGGGGFQANGWITNRPPAGSGIGGCSTGSCGVGALPDGTPVIKPKGMTRAGFRKFMKRLGKGRSMTSLTARRVARGMGIVGTWGG